MKLTTSVWNELLKDALEYENKGERIPLKHIKKKYEVGKWDASLWKFAIDNRRVIHDDANLDISDRKQRAKINGLRKRLRSLTNEIETYQKREDAYLQIEADHNYKPRAIKTSNKKGKHTNATAFGILSDIHVEESVSLDMTDGMNEYNPEIAKERVYRFFVNYLKLVEKEREYNDIDTAVIGLIGDNITGYIHEDLKESNSMSPTEATSYIRDVLMDGINYLHKNGNFKKIYIPCTPGNHGRTTKTKRFATGYKNSYEWMMYQDMKKIINQYMGIGDDVEILTSMNEFVYLDVYDYTVRFGHGDHFRYAGGIGGINVPLKKWLMRINQQHHADMTFIGHWHDILTEVTHDCMINGSVIGMNSYAMQFGGSYRRPQQIFSLLDEKRGFTIRTHIDVTDVDENQDMEYLEKNIKNKQLA